MRERAGEAEVSAKGKTSRSDKQEDSEAAMRPHLSWVAKNSLGENPPC